MLQGCLNQNVLRRADQAGEREHTTRYYVGEASRVYEMRYRLPAALRCKHCVLQWRYRAANRWGTCKDGHQGAECGPQEEFRACADIAIGKKNKKTIQGYSVVVVEDATGLSPGSPENVTATTTEESATTTAGGISAADAATDEVESNPAALDTAIQQYILQIAANKSHGSHDASASSYTFLEQEAGQVPHSFVNFAEQFETDDS